MKKLFFIFLFITALAPLALHAQDPVQVITPGTVGEVITNPCQEGAGEYCLLEPIPFGDGNVPFSKIDSSRGLGSYLQTLFKILLGIIGVLAVVMIIVGGVQYMTTDAIGGKENGKETVTNAIGGLVLALGSWLILNTINPDLVSFKLDVKDIAVEGVQYDAPPQPTSVTVQTSSGMQTFTTMCSQSPVINGIAIVDNMPWSIGIGNDDQIRAQLTAGGVRINHNNCASVGDANCTSVAAMPAATIAKLIAVKNACDAVNGGANSCFASSADTGMWVTGGTECWGHKTHGPGLKAVDIRATAHFNNYVHGSTTFPTGQEREKDGVTYKAEGAYDNSNTTAAHWHAKIMQ